MGLNNKTTREYKVGGKKKISNKLITALRKLSLLYFTSHKEEKG